MMNSKFKTIKSRLLNKSEEETYEEILRVDCVDPSKVFPKVRVADVVRIQNSGLSDEAYSYALKAHFDFVVTNTNYMPLFVIEFDGPTHSDSIQIHRDDLKMQICARFDLPILRINDLYLKRTYRGKMSLLYWIIDVYFLQEAFNEAQANGSIPLDEIFTPMFVLTDSLSLKDMKINFPYQLALSARLNLRKLKDAGKLLDWGTTGRIGRDKNDNFRGFEAIRVDEEYCIYVESGMKYHDFPIDLSELFSELMTITLEEAVQSFLARGEGRITIKEAQSRAKILIEKTSLSSSHTCGFSLMGTENPFK